MYKGKKVFIIQTIVIAIAYVVLTLIADAFGMAKNIVQFRISDALCVLPYFTPAAVPGVFFGCLISNSIIIGPTSGPGVIQELLTTGAVSVNNVPYLYDIVFGSFATLFGAMGAYLIRKYKFLVAIPPVVFNTVIVVLLFQYAYRYEDTSMLKCFCTVGVGEIISCGLLGTALILGLEDNKEKLFPNVWKKSADSEEEATVEKKITLDDITESGSNLIDKE